MKTGLEESVNGTKINGANAMVLEHEIGTITIGKNVNLILKQPIDSYVTISFSFRINLIEKKFSRVLKIK